MPILHTKCNSTQNGLWFGIDTTQKWSGPLWHAVRMECEENRADVHAYLFSPDCEALLPSTIWQLVVDFTSRPTIVHVCE